MRARGINQIKLDVLGMKLCNEASNPSPNHPQDIQLARLQETAGEILESADVGKLVAKSKPS